MLKGRGRYWLVLSVLFVLSFIGLRQLAGNTLVSINISQSAPDTLKIYWTTPAQPGWSEMRSVSAYINARKQRYVLRLPLASDEIQQLRIDPGSHSGRQTQIQSVGLYSLRFSSLSFGGEQGFAAFEPIQHVENLSSGRRLSYTASGNDPGFLVDLAVAERRAGSTLWLQAALLAVLLMSLGSRLPWLAQNLRWVPAGMLIAASAVLALALLSKQGAHPDEYVHLTAANYYASQYVPPQVCSEATRNTYSVYGASRLNKREIAYAVAGRYLQAVEFVPGPEYLKLRFLNVALFFVLVLLAFQSVRARYLFLPLLLTPQSWYLFSYYNSDALSLFAVLMTAYQVFEPDSMLRRLLQGGARPPGYVLWMLGLVLLVAMQYWLKLNYIFYPLLLGMLGLSWLWVNRRMPPRVQSRPLWLIIVLGTLLFLSWEVPRNAINDFELGARIQQCSELLADDAYKPSTPLDQTHANVRLREKGVTLSDMLVQKQWPRRIFYTGLGAYGYTEYLNRDEHYQIASVLILLLFFYVLFKVLSGGGAMARMSVLSTLAAMSGVTLAAVYINWAADFQPQGRYLMVYLPIFGSLIVMYWQRLSVRWLSALASIPFLLALYSFLAIALIEIPR